MPTVANEATRIRDKKRASGQALLHTLYVSSHFTIPLTYENQQRLGSRPHIKNNDDAGYRGRPNRLRLRGAGAGLLPLLQEEGKQQQHCNDGLADPQLAVRAAQQERQEQLVQLQDIQVCTYNY